VVRDETEPAAASRPPRRLAWIIDNAPLLLTVTMLCWAGNFVVGRWSAGHVPPIFLAWSRWTFAGLILLSFAWPRLKSDWPVIRSNWTTLLLLGVTGGGLFNTLQYLALHNTTALNALLINSSGPVFVAIACLTLFGDRLGLGQWGGILLSVVGVLLVGTKGALALLGQIRFEIGDLFMLAAMLTWGIYTAFLRLRPPIHFLSFAVLQAFIAATVNTPFAVWERSTGAAPQPTIEAVLSVAYCAIFPSIIAYLCYNRGVQLIGGARAGAYIHLTTLFGAALSILLLGEQLQLYHVTGFALIIAGVLLAARGKPAAASPRRTS
jgi:drug/metabolite transporter (DMT)-like permease